MKTTLQFKLSFMFFMVMLISATVSISLLLLIFSPIMRKNSETQLSEMAVSINTLAEKLDAKRRADSAKVLAKDEALSL